MANPIQDPEVLGLARQQEMAKLLMQQGLQQPQGQMVSGHYVAPSWTQQLAPAVSMLTGAYLGNKAEQKQLALAEKLRQEGLRDISAMQTARAGVPEQTVYGAGEEGPTMTVTPAVAPDYNRALAIAMNSKNPFVQSIGTELAKGMFVPQKKGIEEEIFTIGASGQPNILVPGMQKAPSELQTAISVLGLDRKPREQWTPQDRMAIEQKVKEIKQSGATNVNVSTEKSYGQAFGQGLAKVDLDLYDQARQSPQILENVQTTKKLLESGKVYTGFGANAKLDLARAGTALGVAGKDTADTVANTQQLFANRAQATLDAIKASGLGSGQGFSNKDREFLEAARLGNITYDKETLRRQLDLEEKAARATANKWNSRFTQIPKTAIEPTGIAPINLPPVSGTINTGTGSGRFPSQSDIQAEIARRQGK